MAQVLKSFAYSLAVGLGSGLSPVAPGTMGTLTALVFSILLCQLSWVSLVLWVVVSIACGGYICQQGVEKLKTHDHPAIVWDEMAAFWLLLLFLPHDFWSLSIAFVLFRIFDILKPWPIAWFDHHIHGGWGIMLDDLIASGFVLICWYLGIYFFN